MPLYEYQCDACGHRFEKIQKFSDALVEECPKCGEKQVRKLVSSPAIQFKGSGWYITDYAKKGMTAADGSKTGESKSSESKSSESKSSDDKGAAPAATASDASTSTSASTTPTTSPATPSTKS